MSWESEGREEKLEDQRKSYSQLPKSRVSSIKVGPRLGSWWKLQYRADAEWFPTPWVCSQVPGGGPEPLMPNRVGSQRGELDVERGKPSQVETCWVPLHLLLLLTITIFQEWWLRCPLHLPNSFHFGQFSSWSTQEGGVLDSPSQGPITTVNALMEKTGQKTWNQGHPDRSGRYALQTWLGGFEPAGRLVLSASKKEDLRKTVWSPWSQYLNLSAVWVCTAWDLWTSVSLSSNYGTPIPASWSLTWCNVWHQSWNSLHSISLSPRFSEWLCLT